MDELLLKLLGQTGLNALKPLLKNESLAAFIVPRVLLSWLQGAQKGNIELSLFDSLNKSEAGYSGEIKIQDTNYSFDMVNGVEVAAMVSLALDQKVDVGIKALDLAKLSKTLDLLVKSSQPLKEPGEGKSPVAPKIAPQEPQDAPKAPNTVARIRSRAMAKTMLVSNKESKTLCKMCGKPQFNKSNFTGCDCLKAMAKSIKCIAKTEGYLLKFEDPDELLTMAEAIGRIR